jgi:hypothetical protein
VTARQYPWERGIWVVAGGVFDAILVSGLWAHAATSHWTPGTSSPYVIFGFLAFLPVVYGLYVVLWLLAAAAESRQLSREKL